LQAAKYSGDVSERSVVRWLHEGLPSIQVRPRGRRLIRVADLDAFLASRRRVQGETLNQLVDDTAAKLGVQRS
jgi:hypothetical protein